MFTLYRFGVSVQFTILGSGSNGNSAYLETDKARLLIDAGLSGKQIRLRLESLGRTLESLTGILITHEHTDHTNGLAVLCNRLKIPVYCNRLTQECIATQIGKPPPCRIFSTGDSFEIEDILVESFSVPHDAQDPAGFLLRTSEGNLGIITDLGHVTKMVVQRVRRAQVLMIEANHDLDMLRNDTKRPWSLKQRILSRHGHLSNVAAAEAIEQIVNQDLTHIYLGHISRDCNDPKLAYNVVMDKLVKIGASHITADVTDQDRANPTRVISAKSSIPVISDPKAP